MSAAKDFLPVRPHLRPKPRRFLLENVPPEVLAKVPGFVAELHKVPVYEQVDRDSHPLGWGYDLTHFISPDEAWNYPIEGQA